MTQINPFTGAMAGSTQVQQSQSVAKERHARRVQNLGKNSALQGEELEHQVESADALHAINDRNDSYQPEQQSPKTKKLPALQDQPDGEDHVDLTA
jgi:hypothetical protein